MKRTLHKLLCGLLAALTLMSVSLASEKIQVAASLSTVGSVSSAVNAVREQLQNIADSGMLDTSEGSRVATLSAELAIYSAATAEVQDSELLLDTETLYTLPETNAPTISGENTILATVPENALSVTLAELADKAQEARECIMDEIRAYGVQTLYDLPIAARFLTPADISVTIDPDIAGLDIPVSLAVLDTPYYQLKISLSGVLENLSEPLTIDLRNADGDGKKIEVTLSDDAFAGFLTLCFDSEDTDLTRIVFIMETPNGPVYNRYRYNDITGKIEGHFDKSGTIESGTTETVSAAPKGNFTDMSSAPKSIQEAVRKAQLQGAVAGYPDGTFRPDNGVTRRAFAKMLMEMLDETDYRLNISMTDVPRNDSFYPYVATVVRKKYMTGYTETFFGAADPVTRQQECAVIGRVLEKRGYMKTMTEDKIATQIQRYKDSNQITIKDARACIALLTEKKVIAPDAKGNFNPTHNMNRGETVELLVALLDVPFQS